jgi:hypothetical protein
VAAASPPSSLEEFLLQHHRLGHLSSAIWVSSSPISIVKLARKN